jgi:hypothetical protein
MSTPNGSTTYDLFVNQGATYSRVFFWQQNYVGLVGGPIPVNLTGYTAAMQIKQYVLGPVVYDAGAAGDIVLGGINGTITLTIDAIDTEGFTWWNGVYDMLLTSAGGQVTRLLMGSVQVSPGVTP